MTIRLKLLRKQSRLTLEALAEQTGLTKSYLSKVERGLSAPSIAVALKLARALRVDVAQLFDEDAQAAPITVVRAAERTSVRVAGQPGKAVYEGIATQVAHKRLLPFMMYPPTDLTTSAFKEHPGEELLFVHQGRVEVVFPDRSIELAVGDVIHFNAQIPHRIRSLGDEAAQVLIVVHDEAPQADADG
ncbi:XRE family transcriptional regulator [Chitiniphilus purpureus]|uniref:XRE family transcriptional regulator n=1 Tax=Chitiniphilus purpureus TaxID=2981137 RepID=A0ABY6DNQ7_9NEIS|nr:XRE family transcriptional regulator [Chitiniphilus sp. CD1]UXY16014.1 XRE family transcriptional regulator [Chitiniphilus sp. CD1]